MVVYCPYCGTQNDEQTGMCRTCNSPLPKVTSTQNRSANTPATWQVQSPSVLVSTLNNLQGLSLFYIKWDITLNGSALLYNNKFQQFGKMEIVLTNRAPAYVLKDMQNQELLRIQQIDFTRFMIAVGEILQGHIEEHLIQETVDYTMQDARSMSSDLGKFVKRRTLNTKDEDETVARISDSDVESVPQGFDVRHCFTVKINDPKQNIGMVFAFVIYNLIRYR